jgi:hypothetical protein
MLKVVLITSITSIAAFFIGLRWGIIGIASAYAIATAVTAYPALAIPFKLINLKVGELSTVLWRPLACSVLMVAIVGLVGSTLQQLNHVFFFVSMIFLGIITYIGASWTFNRKFMRQMFDAVGIKVS